jgi:hypothetical protein
VKRLRPHAQLSAISQEAIAGDVDGEGAERDVCQSGVVEAGLQAPLSV